MMRFLVYLALWVEICSIPSLPGILKILYLIFACQALLHMGFVAKSILRWNAWGISLAIMAYMIFLMFLPTTISKSEAYDEIYQLVGVMIVSIAFWINCKNTQDFRGYFRCFSLIILFVSVFTILHVGVGPSYFLGDENDNGVFLLILLAICLVTMQHAPSKKTKLYYLVLFVLVFAAILATSSRGSLLGLGCLGIAYGIISKRKLLVFTCMFIFAAIGWLALSQTFREDIAEAYRGEGTVDNRLRAWECATIMFIEHPHGVGPGNFKVYFDDYQHLVQIERSRAGREVHSMYFQILSDLGVPGVVLFISLLWYIFSRVKRMQSLDFSEHPELAWISPAAKALGLGLIGHMGAAAGVSTFYYPGFWYVAIAVCRLDTFVEESGLYEQLSTSPRRNTRKGRRDGVSLSGKACLSRL